MSVQELAVEDLQEERILLSPPDVGQAEEDAVAAAVKSAWVAPLGPYVDRFEAEMAEFIGAPAGFSCAALSSGTAGLELALRLGGTKPGDWVLVPTKTFVASANAVVQAGARPMFVDADPATWNLDNDIALSVLESAKRANNLPSAVMLVDLYGTCTDHSELMTWCAEHDVAVVKDAAEAVGSSHDDVSAGLVGDIGVFSFNGNKIMTTSGGGMLVGPSDVMTRARWLASQAREPGDRYLHLEQGFNYRLSSILAALGCAQLARLPEMIERRRNVRREYANAFVDGLGLALNPVADINATNCWLTVLELPPGFHPSVVAEQLDAYGIEVRRSWFPMHQQPLFMNHAYYGAGVADSIFERAICLPSGSAMSQRDIDRVISAVYSVLGHQ